MKKTSILFILLISLVSCSDSATNEFEDENGEVAVKLIKKITLVSAQNSNENATYLFSYDTNNKLTNISNGDGTAIFMYDTNGELSDIVGTNQPLSVEEVVFNSPYDAFEIGEVDQYDNDGNPSVITFYEEEYDYDNDAYYTVPYTAEMEYDSAHNPYFHTMKAAGIIEILDDINLNFAIDTQAPELIQARALLPLKNLSQITYKDEFGNIVYYIDASYTYDEFNYPTHASILATEIDGGDTVNYSITFEYLD